MVSPQMVPAFFMERFKYIGKGNKPMCVGHQTEFIRTASQHVTNEARHTGYFFRLDSHPNAFWYASVDEKIPDCLTLTYRFVMFLRSVSCHGANRLNCQGIRCARRT